MKKYDLEESYVYETCSICRGDMTDIDDIWVDVETDNYVCTDCYRRYNILASKCNDIIGGSYN